MVRRPAEGSGTLILLAAAMFLLGPTALPAFIHGWDDTSTPPQPNQSILVEVLNSPSGAPADDGGQISAIVWPYDGGSPQAVADHLGRSNDGNLGNDIDREAGSKQALRFRIGGTNYQVGNWYSNASNQALGVNGRFVQTGSDQVDLNVTPGGETESVIITELGMPSGVPAMSLVQKTIVRGNGRRFATIYYVTNDSGSDARSIQFFQGVDWNFNGQFSNDRGFFDTGDDIAYGVDQDALDNNEGVAYGGFKSDAAPSDWDVQFYTTIWDRIRGNNLRNGTNFSGDAATAVRWSPANLSPGTTAVIPVIWGLGNDYGQMRDEIDAGLARLYDCGVAAITAPADGARINPLVSPTVNLTVRSALFGLVDAWDVPLRLRITGPSGPVVDQVVTLQDFSVPHREQVLFSWPFDVSAVPLGSYTITYSTELPGDQNAANDEASITVVLTDFSLEPPVLERSAEPLDETTFAFELVNSGAAGVFDLDVGPSTQGWWTDLYGSDGTTLLASDYDGDGTWDFVDPAFDGNVNGEPDLSLPPGSTTVFLTKKVPLFNSVGRVDATVLTASSPAVPGRLDASEAITRVLAGTSFAGKTLHLHGGGGMDTFPDTAGGSTAIPGNGTTFFQQTLPFATDFVLSGASVPVTLFIDSNGSRGMTLIAYATNGSDNVAIGSTTLTVNSDGSAATVFDFPLGADLTVPAGYRFTLGLRNDDAGTADLLHGPTAPSRADFTTPTFIRFASAGTYDAPWPAGNLTRYFFPGDTVYVRAVVEDPFGAGDIGNATSLPPVAGVTLSITAPSGTVVLPASGVGFADGTNVSNNGAGAPSDVYEASWVVPPAPEILAHEVHLGANESNGVVAVTTLSFDVVVLTRVLWRDFELLPDGTDVLVRWTTASEFANGGFVVSAAPSKDGPWTEIGPFIPSLAEGAHEGASYAWRHEDADLLPRPWYRVEALDLRGRRSPSPALRVSLDLGAPLPTWDSPSEAGSPPAGPSNPEGPSSPAAPAAPGDLSEPTDDAGPPPADTLRGAGEDEGPRPLFGGAEGRRPLDAPGLHCRRPGPDTLRVELVTPRVLPGPEGPVCPDYAHGRLPPEEGGMPARGLFLEVPAGRELVPLAADAPEGGAVPGARPDALFHLEARGRSAGRRLVLLRLFPVARGAGGDTILRPRIRLTLGLRDLPSQAPGAGTAAAPMLLGVEGLASTGLPAPGALVGTAPATGLPAPDALAATASAPLVPPPADRLFFETRAEGFHLLPWSALQVFWPAVGPSAHGDVGLFFDGEPLPVDPRAEGLVFWSSAPTDKATDAWTWELRRGLAAAARPSQATGLPTTEPPAFTARANALVTERFDGTYWLDAPGPQDLDRWFDDVVIRPGSPTEKTVLLDDLITASGDEARIEVDVLAMAQSPLSDVDHRVEIRVNGVAVASKDFDGRGVVTVSSDFDAALLQPGSNVIRIDAVDTGGWPGSAFDPFRLHGFRLFAPRALETSARPLTWTTGSGSWAFGLDGFAAPPVVWDVTDPRAPEVLPVEASLVPGADYVASLSFRGQRRFAAALPAAMAVPQALRRPGPPSLLESGRGADWIAVAPAAFHDALAPLAALRAGQGLRVLLVEPRAVYESFSGGHPRAEAFRRFLRHARDAWPGAAPRFLLLVGRASYDLRGRVASLDSVVASPLIHVEGQGEIPADPWYGLLDEDELPDVIVGRLPARNVAEVQAMVAKLLAYAAAPDRSGFDARLYGGADDDLEDFADSLTREFAAIDAPVFSLVEELPGPTAWQTAWSEANRPLLACFAGHGSPDAWAAERLLARENVSSLPGGALLPAVLSMACLDGYHADPVGEGSLAEALIRRDGGGAIAVFASTALTASHVKESLLEGFRRSLYENRDPLLGEAVLAARLAVLAQGDERERVALSHVLFGDPATRLALPFPMAPGAFAALGTPEAVTLSWTAPNPLPTSYRLWRRRPDEATASLLTVLAPTSTSHVDDQDAPAGTVYLLEALDGRGFASAPAEALLVPISPLPQGGDGGGGCAAGGTGDPMAMLPMVLLLVFLGLTGRRPRTRPHLGISS